jgi:hypothetical protein
MTSSPLKKLLYLIVVLSALLTTNGIAKSCSSGMTAISTTQTSGKAIGQSNSCLVISSSGSIAPSGSSDTVISRFSDVITGVFITNNGSLPYALKANNTVVRGFLNMQDSSIISNELTINRIKYILIWLFMER